MIRPVILAVPRLTQVRYYQRVTTPACKSWGTLFWSRWWVTIQIEPAGIGFAVTITVAGRVFENPAFIRLIDCGVREWT